MAPQPPPLDETEYDNPLELRGLPGGSLNSESILWYFMNSPFFDPTSNNLALFNQAQGPERDIIFSSRHKFEEALRARYPTGLSYFVVAEPKAPGEPFVIQKQWRERDEQTGEIREEVQGTWFTQGTKILMAPSLLDVLQSRLLSATTRIQEVFELSQKLSHWSPATGHTYLPSSYEPSKAASRTASRMGSPVLAPVAEPDAPASQGGPATTAATTDPTVETTSFSDALFLSSLNLTNQYGHEFMDENPLQGEPGSFVFTNTSAHVDARNRAQQAQVASQSQTTQPSQPSQPSQTVTAKTETQSSAPSVAATPKHHGSVGTPGPAEAISRKGSVASLPKGGKERRRKSKGLTSPTTPTVPQLP